jgi:hypothetical protein
MGRVRLTNHDRWFLIQLYRWFPSILQILTIIRPETLVRWHRAGFRWYWRWKSNARGGRPQIQTELRVLIRQMSIALDGAVRGGPRREHRPAPRGPGGRRFPSEPADVGGGDFKDSITTSSTRRLC